MITSPGAHYHDGKFGEDRWMIATCRAFNSFCVTDSLTHTQTDFIIGPMLADSNNNNVSEYDVVLIRCGLLLLTD